MSKENNLAFVVTNGKVWDFLSDCEVRLVDLDKLARTVDSEGEHLEAAFVGTTFWRLDFLLEDMLDSMKDDAIEGTEYGQCEEG
jgi:hypothetical protein